MDEELYKKLTIECTVCKTKFELWISLSRYSPELEENIRKNFYKNCPVCKIIAELEEEKGRS